MKNKLWQKISLGIALWLCLDSNALAFSSSDALAVMDFGTRPGATTAEINIQNAEYTTSEYLISSLVKSKYIVQDKDMVMHRLKDAGLKTAGIIDPDTAKAIGDMLGVRYIMYGNVVNVNVSQNGVGVTLVKGCGSVDVCTVKAHVAARIMDVQTGDVVAMIKGDGQSKSSYVSLGSPLHGIVVSIGTKNVTMDSVHNAIRKAGEQIVTKLAADKKGR